MVKVHPVQEEVSMAGHVFRLVDFEADTPEEASRYAHRAKAKGWKTYLLEYTHITHVYPPELPHGGILYQVKMAPVTRQGPCNCRYCLPDVDSYPSS